MSLILEEPCAVWTIHTQNGERCLFLCLCLAPWGSFSAVVDKHHFRSSTDCSTDVPLGSVTAVSGIQSLFSLDGGEDRVSKRIHFASVISSPAKRKAQNGNGVFVV